MEKYTLKELSNNLDISMRDLKRHINRGALRVSKVGQRYFVRTEDIDEFLDNICEVPFRNYLCGNYDTCLDRAAEKNKVFSCENCRRFIQAEKQELSTAELGGMLSLWNSVFGSTISVH
ncbi:MAG: helix-turn-helix domain-containing protein [Desulfobacteraceae bacterium]|nr:helix-turn-helix domain-containing protein [Desulfobacteraceae bacterium]